MTLEGERLAILETNMRNVEQKVDDGFRNAKEDNEALKKLMTDFIEKSEKRFASKWVESVLLSIGGVVGLTIVGALLNLIITK